MKSNFFDPIYRPLNKYLWDTWFIKQQNTYHAFYLQCTNNIQDPEERHNLSSIGHATSNDLIKWHEQPTALLPTNNAWDDLCLWTGSTIKHNDLYYMFYTGRSKQTGLTQKIGFATSKNLNSWTKYHKPILEAQNELFSITNTSNEIGSPPAWRDPFVFKNNNKFYLILSARIKTGTIYNACLAIFESNNLIEWKKPKVLLDLGLFDEMETPQIIKQDDYYYLLFSCKKEKCHPSIQKKAHSALYCFRSKNIYGPYEKTTSTGAIINYKSAMYNVRLLQKKENLYWAIGFLQNDKNNRFIGGISQPFRVRLPVEQIINIVV